MAESSTKQRQTSVAAKVAVATPNIGGPSGLVSLETALGQAIGATIRLQTTIPSYPTVEGTVYSVSVPLSLLVLTLPTSPPSQQFLSLSSIQNFNLLSLPSTNGTLPVLPPLPPLNQAALQKRLATAVAQLKAQEAKRGKGVDKEAQDIFDAISRMLPTAWKGTSIDVMDQVMIIPPYRVEDCVAKEGAPAKTLPQVKKMLENERRKLSEKGSNKAHVAAAIPLNGPRKGG